MKTIGYTRVSTEEQNSLPQQRQAIEQYCLANKLNLVTIIEEDGISGEISVQKRPAGGTIAGFISQGITNIVAVKLDRMFRNTIDALTQTEAWLCEDVALHLLDFGGKELNTRSPEGRMMFTMRAAMAQMEREIISARTQTAMDFKRSKGECLGQVPFGYIRVGELVAPLPSRPAIINTIKELNELGYGSRHIASCIQADYNLKCTHTTVINIINKEITNEKAILS